MCVACTLITTLLGIIPQMNIYISWMKCSVTKIIHCNNTFSSKRLQISQVSDWLTKLWYYTMGYYAAKKGMTKLSILKWNDLQDMLISAKEQEALYSML